MQEWILVKEIKEKVNRNNLIVTGADKGRTLVILGKQEYNSKSMDFIDSSEFTQTITDPTKSFQTSIKSSLNRCNTIIPKDKKMPIN
jgi:hypothetical protein